MSESTAAARLDLGRVGIWSTSVRFSPEGADAAKELEQLGFRTVWVPGGVDAGVIETLDQLLDQTATLKLATGIINIWKHEPAELAAWWHGEAPERQERLFLGLGVSHGPLIGEAWEKPLAKMRGFLDGLDAAGMPRDRLCLAALGPKMLELAAARTAGAHPYMVTARHTAFARKTMGPDALLAPEQGVVLESDPARAREIARGFVSHYARLPNYANSWRREGFSDAEIESLADRLIDALIAWGDVDAIRARVDEHFAGGADHVCLQVIGAGGLRPDIEQDRQAWRKLAGLMG
ncbi:MAG: TIGR03620 family F420-dependent LLM class oxidoreductase [Novosphingobium sp.]|nr:TIGR03620 family F420-dependent LLM class oxidoreductase [Novosphingobium sp.]